MPPRLDLYPKQLAVRYRDNLAQLTLTGVGSVQPEGNVVRIASGDDAATTVAFLAADGRLLLTVIGPMDPAEDGGLVPEADVPTPAPEPPVKAREGQEDATRVMLTGRLGRGVHLRTTAKGVVVGRVSLAVHQGNETVWHTILFFNEKAQKAAEELAKGQLVTVVGYKHLREVQSRNGLKQVEEIYAAGVQLSK